MQQQTITYRPRKSVKKSGAALLLLPLVLIATKPFLPWRYNATASEPLGYYWRGSKDHAVKGSLVSLCLPEKIAVYAKQRGYIGAGFCPGWSALLIKPIAGVAGDVVDVRPEGVWINDVAIPRTPVFEQDSEGRRHAYQFLGRHHIPPGSIFLLSSYHERSFDSRYWGLLPRSNIVETMTEAWTW